jgi:four helix bundle protein
MQFTFEKLEVYQRSLAWVEEVEKILERAGPKVSRSFADQLSRASLSIPLNIAEGNGRWHKAEKRQFFWIARGSLFECVPLIEILRRRSILEEAETTAHRERLEVIGKMLTNLVKAHSV